MDLNQWGLNFIQEIHEKWSSLRDSHHFFKSGYKVFYSPISQNPQLMIIGYNPGGGSESFNEIEAQQLPIQHEYFVENYHIAKKMRSLFQNMDKENLLRDSIKFNLIYFRSNNISQWNRLEKYTRKNIEEFCVSKTREAIEFLSPKLILAEGISTYSLLAKTLGLESSSKKIISKGRSIYIESQSDKFKLVGIIHPSGARVSKQEWEIVSSNLLTIL